MTTDIDQARPRSRASRWIFLAAVLAVLGGAAIAVVAWKPWAANEFTVTGDLTLKGSGLKWGSNTAQCSGDGGYEDINPQTSIVVADADGKTVAVGQFDGPGFPTAGITSVRPGTCTFKFSISVPDGSKFYGITVGRRGTMQYSREQLNAPVHLTLT